MDVTDNEHPVRQRVLDALSLIASSDRISSLRPDLEPGRYAYLVCRMWLNEVYVPGTRYLDGLKGDRDTEAVADFRRHFDEDENRWLERFNRFLELRLDRVRADLERGVFPPGERWSHVVRDADNLISLLGGNPRASGKALDEAARGVLEGGL